MPAKAGKKAKPTRIKKEKLKAKSRPQHILRKNQAEVPQLTLNDVVGALVDENSAALEISVDDIGEPDETLLAQQEEELTEDLLIPVRNHELAAELAEDPVRLYLREIGQVKLSGLG